MARLNLGKDARTNEVVSISQGDRLRGLYCLGSTGTGKTTFQVNLILQDIKAGRGLCFLSPVGDAIKDILTRLPSDREKDVILFNPLFTAMVPGLNLFACPDPSSDEQVALTSGLVMHVFQKVFGVGSETPRLADVLRNVTITLIESNLTMAEIPLLLQDNSFRSQVVRNLRNDQVRWWWQTYNNLKPSEQIEWVSSTLNKVNAFLTDPLIARIISQTKSTIDIRRVIDENKILLVELDPRLEDIATLLGTAIISKILEAAYSRTDAPQQERKLFGLYVDELQRYETEDMATLLAEARKFGIATTIAHQFREQLSDRMKGATFNAATTVVFKIGADDKDEVAALFNTTPSAPELQREEELIPRQNVVAHLLNYGHENPQVTDFIIRYLAPLELASKQQPVSHPDGITISRSREHSPRKKVEGMIYPHADFPEGSRYRYYPTDIQKGLLKLNTIFYETMAKSKEDIMPLYRQMEQELSHFLGFPHYFDGEVLKKWFFQANQAKDDWFEGDLLSNQWKEYFWLGLNNYFKWPKDKVPYTHAKLLLFLRLRLQKMWIYGLGKISDYPELFLYWYQPYFDMPKIAEPVHNDNHWYGIYDHVKVVEIADKVTIEERKRSKAFMDSLKAAMEALSKTPIYKGSGHWVQKEGIRQTHADKQNEIGNVLTHLARFTAWAKLGNMEYVLQTLPLPPRGNVKLSDLINTIRHRNVADGYLRPVSEVKDELRTRRDSHVPQLTSKERL